MMTFKDVIDKIFKMASKPSAHLQRPQGKVMLNTTLRNFITYNVILFNFIPNNVGMSKKKPNK